MRGSLLREECRGNEAKLCRLCCFHIVVCVFSPDVTLFRKGWSWTFFKNFSFFPSFATIFNPIEPLFFIYCFGVVHLAPLWFQIWSFYPWTFYISNFLLSSNTNIRATFPMSFESGCILISWYPKKWVKYKMLQNHQLENSDIKGSKLPFFFKSPAP